MHRVYDGEYCLECGRPATDTHHLIPGANRENCERAGLTVRLCRDCHRRLHDTDDAMMRRYKKLGQLCYEYAHDHTQYMAIFGRNYL